MVQLQLSYLNTGSIFGLHTYLTTNVYSLISTSFFYIYACIHNYVGTCRGTLQSRINCMCSFTYTHLFKHTHILAYTRKLINTTVYRYMNIQQQIHKPITPLTYNMHKQTHIHMRI